MQKSLNDMSFSERRRVPIGALIGGLLVLPLAIQALRIDTVGKFAYVLLFCSLFMFVVAFLNRKAGSTPLMILKDKGIWFFNADGLVPYTSIEAVEVESYNTLKDIQRNLVLHIHAEKADTLPHFNNKRWKLLFMMPDARKGAGSVNTWSGSTTGAAHHGGQSADPDLLAEEIVYRIDKAHREEEARQGAIWVSSSSPTTRYRRFNPRRQCALGAEVQHGWLSPTRRTQRIRILECARQSPRTVALPRPAGPAR